MVITGDAGFLGSHLCDRLIAEGTKVICLGNLLTGNISKIAHLFENDNFIFIRYDVANYIHIKGTDSHCLWHNNSRDNLPSGFMQTTTENSIAIKGLLRDLMRSLR